jgi:hypothetical protein
MRGDRFTIVAGFKVYVGDEGGDPVNQLNEDQLLGWLRVCGFSEIEARRIIKRVEKDGSMRITLP